MIELLNVHPVLSLVFVLSKRHVLVLTGVGRVATLVSLRASVTTKRARLPAALSMSCQSSLQNEPLLVYAGSKTALMHVLVELLVVSNKMPWGE